MEMKGIIEHSILCEDVEIYRGWVSYRETRLCAWAGSEAKCQDEVHKEQRGKGQCQLWVTE